MKRKDFIFTRDYRVKNHFNQTRGKWSSAIANSVPLDSKKFHIVYSDLFFQRVHEISRRALDRKDMNEIQYKSVQSFIKILKPKIKESNFADYAFTSVIKGKDSQT